MVIFSAAGSKNAYLSENIPKRNLTKIYEVVGTFGRASVRPGICTWKAQKPTTSYHEILHLSKFNDISGKVST